MRFVPEVWKVAEDIFNGMKRGLEDLFPFLVAIAAGVATYVLIGVVR